MFDFIASFGAIVFLGAAAMIGLGAVFGFNLTFETVRRMRTPFCVSRIRMATQIAACFVFVFVSLDSAAQEKNRTDTLKYWVFFDDKPVELTKAPAAVIDESAVLRRHRRGTAPAADIDRPVSRTYINSVTRTGTKVVNESRWLNAITVELTAGQLEEIKSLPFVSETRLVGIIRPDLHPTLSVNAADTFPINSPAELHRSSRRILDYGASTTQLEIMNAIDPIERGFIGTGVTLGFIDTEYDTLNHAVFANLKADNRLLASQFFTPGPQSNRHGVSVASVAVGFAEGQLIGPAYDASVLLATTEFAPSETNQEEDAFVAAVEWMEGMGVDVINTSLGYTTFDGGQNSYTVDQLDGDTGITTRISDIAASLGVVVVTSAGNSGCSAPESCWYYIGTPADADSVISVGAVTSTGDKAAFSSFGPTADGRIKPEVSAMGQGVYVASGVGYGLSNGTSFSSPLVAAVACQILQANPDLTPMEVRQVLMDTASQKDSPDNSLGYGIVNAGEAVDRALSLRDTSLGLAPDISFLVTSVYPNPASDKMSLVVKSETRQTMGIEVYDLTGRLRYAVPERVIHPGSNTITIPDMNLAAGLYTLRLSVDGTSVSRRVSIVK